MKIAILISGRIVRYDSCLINQLKNDQRYEVDVFASINDEECEYYDEMKKKLCPWLKGLKIQKYQIPENFSNTHVDTLRQIVDGKKQPLNVLSMFYNDRTGFEMATEYADKNMFEYDCYVKFRSDLISDRFPDFKKSEEYKIYSSIPRCSSQTTPLFDRQRKCMTGSVLWVSAAIDYGNRKSMDAYTQTYKYILEINKMMDGDYPIQFETNCTQNVYDKKLNVERFKYDFKIDINRRMFDALDDRPSIPGSLNRLNIKNYKK
jgi:hypothetical protein